MELHRKYDLLYCYDGQKEALEKALELIKTPGIKEAWKNKRDAMLRDKIDVTAYMVWFVENYPESINMVKKDPQLQYKIKNF